MSGTIEGRWRRRTRTPVVLATAATWVAVLGLGHGAMRPMGGPAHFDQVGAALPMAALGAVAMMTPLLVPALRHVIARSLRRRRRRAAVLVLVAHGLVWLAGGVVLEAVATRLLGVLPPREALLLGVIVVVVWQCAPAAQRCRNRHHLHPPLAAFGRDADLGVLRFGTLHAAYCLGACWDLMLLPSLCGRWNLPAMLLAGTWVLAVSLETPVAPSWRPRLPVTAARVALVRLRARPFAASA